MSIITFITMEEQQKPMITIKINGQARTTQAKHIADLLHELAVTATYVVVLLDGEIIPRTDFAQTLLRDDSNIEIITLAGGG